MVLALVSACSSSAPSAGARYEQIVMPANAAWATFVTQARTWPGGEIPASGSALAQNVVRTWEKMNRQLLAHQWPGSDRHDIAALVSSDTKVYQKLEQLPARDVVEAWWANLIASSSAEQAAAGRVRIDLHLPTSPAPQGGEVPPS